MTALPHEMAAVTAMLIDAGSYEKAGQFYTCGDIPSANGGRHEVVAVLLPDMGNNLAAAVATRLLGQYSTIEDVVMCGIAGGVPKFGDAEKDVRLGDIVYSGRGGVIQFDNKKEQVTGWEARHPPRPPSARMLAACRQLEVERELNRFRWEAFLPLAANLPNAMRPRDDQNAKGNPISYPADPTRRAGLPRVFAGEVASSNTLLRDPSLRDKLQELFGVKAVEMEGSGVADAAWLDGAGYILVRGIVDYCDSEKGDLWQRYAAVAAAAYMRAMIEVLTPT